jgi:hypothetical protein
MRFFALACALVAAMVTISKADQPNQQVLSDMGLGSLVVMSDSDALSVRGMGYAPVKAYGSSWASISGKGGSAGSKNSYSATGKHAAWGEANSEAGIEIKKGHHNTKSVTVFAGGSSRAGRK